MPKINSHKTALNFDVKFIQTKIEEGFSLTELVKKQDLVMLIGNTGVGKSTTGNYLLGQKMHEVQDLDGRWVIEVVPPEEPIMKIGHDMVAQTLYATPASSERFAWTLLDCPGFLGNRDKIEETVVESISTELAVRTARQIKGIIVLISLHSLRETKLMEFRALVKTLMGLFKNPGDMVKYTTFLVTKKDSFYPEHRARNDVQSSILKVIRDCQQKIALIENSDNKFLVINDLDLSDYKNIEAYFSKVQEKESEIIFVNPLDDGTSRNLIIEKINSMPSRVAKWRDIPRQKIKKFTNFFKGFGQDISEEAEVSNPITIEDFNFGEYDSNRTLFNHALYDRAEDGLKILSDIKDGIDDCHDSLVSRLELENRVETIRDFIEILKQGSEMPVADQHIKRVNLISQYEEIKTQSIKLIKIYHGEAEDIKKKIDAINLMLRTINTSDTKLFCESIIDENVTWGAFFGWRQKEFDINTGSEEIPIQNIEKQMMNGKWYDEDDSRKDKGFYKVTYKSNYRARPAHAKVSAFIAQKDDPSNKILIRKYEEEKIKLTSKRNNLNKNISDLQAKIETLEANIHQAKENLTISQKQIELKIEEYEKDLKDMIKKIEDYKNGYIMKKEIAKEKLTNFEMIRNEFEVTYKVAQILEFFSELMSVFVKQYDEFLKNLPKYQKFLENDNPDIEKNIELLEEKSMNINDYLDPISGQLIKEPVITSNGLLFDEYSLMKRFESEDGNKIMEFKFISPKNNEEYVIKRGEWTRSSDIKEIINRNFFSPNVLRNSQKVVKSMTAEELQLDLQETNKKIENLEAELEKLQRELQDAKLYQSKILRHIDNKEREVSKIEVNQEPNFPTGVMLYEDTQEEVKAAKP